MTTVVAWERSDTAAGSMLYRPSACWRPAVTASAKSCGVVGTLAIAILPVSSSIKATSVNVPPISTPTRQPISETFPFELSLDPPILIRPSWRRRPTTVGETPTKPSRSSRQPSRGRVLQYQDGGPASDEDRADQRSRPYRSIHEQMGILLRRHHLW